VLVLAQVRVEVDLGTGMSAREVPVEVYFAVVGALGTCVEGYFGLKVDLAENTKGKKVRKAGKTALMGVGKTAWRWEGREMPRSVRTQEDTFGIVRCRLVMT
jgi:hypothetical protein